MFWLLLLITAFGQGTGTNKPIEKPRPLLASSQRKIQLPSFPYFGDPQCDEDGNVYFHIARDRFATADVIKLSSDGVTAHQYAPSDEYADSAKNVFIDFFVTHSGSLFVLTSFRGGKTNLLPFDSNGKMQTPIPLDVPDGLEARTLVVFDSGSFFVSGFFDVDAPKDLQGKQFLAIFDTSGRVVKKIQAGLQDVGLAHENLTVTDNGVTLGDDQKIYFLRRNDVLVISARGDVVQRLAFKKPDPDTLATRVYESQGLLVIRLLNTESDPKTNAQRVTGEHFLVLDSTTGERYGYYEPEAKLGQDDVCFSRHDGFVFQKFEGAQQEFITAPLR